jgi:hypothetical protein
MTSKDSELTGKALMGIMVQRQQKVRIANRYALERGVRVFSREDAIDEVERYVYTTQGTVAREIDSLLTGGQEECRWHSVESGYDIRVHRT